MASLWSHEFFLARHLFFSILFHSISPCNFIIAEFETTAPVLFPTPISVTSQKLLSLVTLIHVPSSIAPDQTRMFVLPWALFWSTCFCRCAFLLFHLFWLASFASLAFFLFSLFVMSVGISYNWFVVSMQALPASPLLYYAVGLFTQPHRDPRWDLD